MTAGILVTPRLRLRPLQNGDHSAIAALFADHAVRRYLAVGDLSPSGAANFATRLIRTSADEWREGGCGILAITLLDDDLAIGYCGLRLLPDRISAVELLYALAQSHWGQGLATEAAHAMLAWGFDALPVREIQAFTRPEHGASRRVMEKLGLRHLGNTDRYYGETLVAYGLARQEWRANEAIPINPPPAP